MVDDGCGGLRAYAGGVDPRSRALEREITLALPGLLSVRVEAAGADPIQLEEAISHAVAEAGEGLRSLLARPFDRQPETPLEVVRRALEPLTTAMAAAGIEPPERDDEQARVVPEDPYGLAPASAGELGEGALEASLAWGLAKTAALTRPLLLVVSSNLMDASRFEGPAAAAGYRLEVRSDTASSVTPLVAFIDLEHERADDSIRRLADDGVRVVAYGPHVDDHALVRAMALGAMAAEPRSRMFRDPSQYLPPLV
jgi:hypothetical protein